MNFFISNTASVSQLCLTNLRQCPATSSSPSQTKLAVMGLIGLNTKKKEHSIFYDLNANINLKFAKYALKMLSLNQHQGLTNHDSSFESDSNNVLDSLLQILSISLFLCVRACVCLCVYVKSDVIFPDSLKAGWVLTLIAVIQLIAILFDLAAGPWPSVHLHCPSSSLALIMPSRAKTRQGKQTTK